MASVHWLRRSGRFRVSTATPSSSTSYSTVAGAASSVVARSVIARLPQPPGRWVVQVLGRGEHRGTLLDEGRNALGGVGLPAHPAEQLPLAVERRLPVGLAEHLVGELLGQSPRRRRGVCGDLRGQCQRGGQHLVTRYGAAGDP